MEDEMEYNILRNTDKAIWYVFNIFCNIDNFIHRKETIEHNTNQTKLNNN